MAGARTGNMAQRYKVEQGGWAQIIVMTPGRSLGPDRRNDTGGIKHPKFL